MFGFLNGLDTKTQTKIIENWNKMLKKSKEKERVKKEKEEKERKETADKEKMFKFIRENPPRSFKDIMICGQIMAKYGNPYTTNNPHKINNSHTRISALNTTNYLV